MAMNKTEKRDVDSSLSSIAKTSIFILIGLAISKILTYAYRIVAARYFGPEVYGLFSISVIILGWFVAFASIGLGDGLLRYVSMYRSKHDYAKSRYVLQKATKMLTINGIVAAIIMFALSGVIAQGIFHNASLAIFIKIFSIGVPLITISLPYLSGMKAFERVSEYSFIYNIAQNVVKVAALAAFIAFGVGAQSISASYLVGLAVVLVGAYFYSRIKLPIMLIGKIEDKSGRAWKEVISYSWPLMLYGVVSAIMYWIDSFSIGYYKDAVAVGWYNAAVPVAMLITLAPEIFSTLFFPMITAFYAKKKIGTIKQLSKQVMKWIVVVNIPILAICLVFPEAVINVLFGSEYLVASTALQILAIGTMFSAIAVVPMQLLSMAGKSKTLMINIAIFSAVNFVLNSIFIPMDSIFGIENATGINGAAVATAISLALLTISYFAQAYANTGVIPLRRKLLNAIASAILPMAALVLIRQKFDPNLIGIVVLGIAFAAAYILMLYVTKSIDDNDKMIAKKIISKTGIRISSTSIPSE